jgi:hypothetical protein
VTIKTECDADVLSEDNSLEIPCLKMKEPEVSHVVKCYLCSCESFKMCVFISRITSYLQCGTNK